MVAMVAVLLANADGRAGAFLSWLLAARRDRSLVIGIAFGSFILNAVIAAIAGSVANQMIGQGIIGLLVGFALISAAAALLWRGRVTLSDDGALTAPAPILALRMLLAQFGDRSHFLIAALAATSGAGYWAAAGGFAGWVLAMLPFLAFGPELAARRGARLIRWGSAAVLALWGLRSAMAALGLIAP